MFHIGDKVIIKYNPPLYMKGCIEYVRPIGVITYDFGNGVYLVALDSGNEYMFDSEQLEVNEMNKVFDKEMLGID